MDCADNLGLDSSQALDFAPRDPLVSGTSGALIRRLETWLVDRHPHGAANQEVAAYGTVSSQVHQPSAV